MNEEPDQWHYFLCSIGDDQASIYVNTSVSATICSAPIWLAELHLTYKSPSENGLPTNEEFEAVSNIEDIVEAFSKDSDDWYVGRVTSGGQRLFYVYTSKDESIWIKFVEKLVMESGYDIQMIYREDADQKAYHEVLYPTEDDWQVIKDLQVIDSLRGHGDNGSEPRRIDHWIYFDDKHSSVDFVIWAENDRFTEEDEFSDETDDGKYCVRLFHTGTCKLGDISSHTITLRRKAVEHGGRYDGWETQIKYLEG